MVRERHPEGLVRVQVMVTPRHKEFLERVGSQKASSFIRGLLDRAMQSVGVGVEVATKEKEKAKGEGESPGPGKPQPPQVQVEAEKRQRQRERRVSVPARQIEPPDLHALQVEILTRNMNIAPVESYIKGKMSLYTTMSMMRLVGAKNLDELDGLMREAWSVILEREAAEKEKEKEEGRGVTA